MAEVAILQIIPRIDAGGSEQAALEIAEALSRAGALALVATEGGRMAPTFTQAGGEIVLLPVASKNPVNILANARRLAGLIEERGISLVHARSRAPAWSALIAAQTTRRPFVTTYHGAYSTPGPFKNFYNSVMARGDRVIANSRYTADLIVSRHEISPHRIRVIYRGVDLSKFAPELIGPDRLARLRDLWLVREAQPVVLHAARLTSWKGQVLVIEAMRRLRDEGRLGDAVFILAGDAQGRDSYQSELEKLIARSGLAGRVQLVGHCDDMPAAFALAQVAVIASTSAETFGRTSIEAQAMGCPVIVSALGATPETIEPIESDGSGTGWLVPPGDIDVLVNRIWTALRLTALERSKIGTRARAHVTALFQLAEMQVKTLAVYDELLGTRLGKQFMQTSSRVLQISASQEISN
jgi:glycosyltransferase involved in cell wall biosynthesis